MVNTQLIFDVLPAISITIGVIYYIMVLRNQEKARQIQLVTQISNMTSEENQKRGMQLFNLEWTDYNDLRARRNANKTQQMQLETRQAQLFMPIYDKFNSPEVVERGTEILQWKWDSAEDFWASYGSETNPLGYKKWNLHAGFFEGIGVLVKRELIDVELVDDLMSISIILFWEKLGPVIVDGRTRYNMPQLWEYAEYLYNRISSVAEKQHPELSRNPLGNP